MRVGCALRTEQVEEPEDKGEFCEIFWAEKFLVMTGCGVGGRG